MFLDGEAAKVFISERSGSGGRESIELVSEAERTCCNVKLKNHHLSVFWLLAT